MRYAIGGSPRGVASMHGVQVIWLPAVQRVQTITVSLQQMTVSSATRPSEKESTSLRLNTSTQDGPGRWSVEFIRELESAWARSLALTPADRNRLLAVRMKAATQEDPFAYDIVRDDTKEFMSGRIDGREFYERFMSVLGYASGDAPGAPSEQSDPAGPSDPSAPPSPTAPEAHESQPHASQPVNLGAGPPEQLEGSSEQPSGTAQEPTGERVSAEAETWFKELAMLLPSLAKRAELLQQCEQPDMAPHPAYRAAAHAVRAAALAAIARQQQEAAAAAAAAKDSDDAEADEVDNGEVAERLDTSTVYEQQVEDYEDELETDEDIREFKGWQVLNRDKMADLVGEILKQQEAEDAQRRQTSAQASMSQPSTADTPAASRAANTVLVPGLEGIHYNSVASRPARAMKGKKSGARAVMGQAPPGSINVLVWLRQDLRLHDNPALSEAARLANLNGGTVTLMYVHSPNEDGDASNAGHHWRSTGASLLWQQEALSAFNADLLSQFGPGASVVLRTGPYLQAIQEVAQAVGAWHVFCNRRYEPGALEVDEAVTNALAALGYQVQTYNAALLREPWDVRIDMRSWSGHFGTFTPFSKACDKLQRLSAPLKPPRKLPVTPTSPAELCNSHSAPSDLGLYQPPKRSDGTVVDWGQGIRQAWDISEAGALATLDRFFSVGLSEYERARQLADGSAVSRLSPYLRSGLLSPRLLWQRMQEKQPSMTTEPIRRHYMDVEWDWSDEGRRRLRAWQRGQTGYPLVDAGMRELWSTGWMQQTLRMVCAAFLTEHLQVHWVEGARWFHGTLVDADLAINSMMWQNAAKSGLDQWDFPLDPTGKSQDPNGAYIRKWVPELASLPSEHLHRPWLAPPQVLTDANLTLGITYPQRVVTEEAVALRKRHVTLVQQARVLHVNDWVDSRGYDLVMVPKGSSTHLDGRKVPVFTRQDLRKLPGLRPEAGVSSPRPDAEVQALATGVM